MFKTTITFFTLACLCLNVTYTNAQTVAAQKVISLDFGLSLVAGAIDEIIGNGEGVDNDTFNHFIEIENSSVSGGQALVLSCDYGMSHRWSLGGFVSTQRRHGSTDFSFENSKGALITEKVNFDLRRYTFGFTPKIHYGKNERSDVYSGLRMGMVFWSNSIDSESGNFDLFDKLTLTRPIFSLTVVGIRFYPLENLGINFELNLGAPNIVGFGVVAKIP